LEQALERDGTFGGDLELARVVEKKKKKKVGEEEEYDDDDSLNSRDGADRVWRSSRRLKEIRDRYDAPSSSNTERESNRIAQSQFRSGANTENTRQQRGNNNNNVSPLLASQYADESPEDIYNIGTTYFNTKEYRKVSQIFQLSCLKSDRQLHLACTNAVYLRTNICDWGYEGEEFAQDMKIIEEVTLEEARMFRSTVQSDYYRDDYNGDVVGGNSGGNGDEADDWQGWDMEEEEEILFIGRGDCLATGAVSHITLCVRVRCVVVGRR